jgi:hypothetical protein
MKKWYLVSSILAIVLLAVGCAPAKVPPPAAISEIYALSGSEAFEKYLEVKDVAPRQDFFYVMVYIKSLPGAFTTLDDALIQANGFAKNFCENVVGILKRYNINENVSVWVQLPLKDGGASVLGHVDYDRKTIHDFERYKP